MTGLSSPPPSDDRNEAGTTDDLAADFAHLFADPYRPPTLEALIAIYARAVHRWSRLDHTLRELELAIIEAEAPQLHDLCRKLTALDLFLTRRGFEEDSLERMFTNDLAAEMRSQTG